MREIDSRGNAWLSRLFLALWSISANRVRRRYVARSSHHHLDQQSARSLHEDCWSEHDTLRGGCHDLLKRTAISYQRDPSMHGRLSETMWSSFLWQISMLLASPGNEGATASKAAKKPEARGREEEIC